ncbi:MAG: ATP-dependent helicase [Candidatus Omnitrophica bacterium]|nr:ATP-dependent helicase [Candidatus Omnitrophota bacterium]MDD5430113.1 ATP-dependent helicase [Candidatus Omnitrophota bacterium]
MKSYKLNPYKASTLIDYQEKLNPDQLKVVKEADGPALVLAGAGSGKTRVLIYRLAWLLEKGIPANNILLVTFTNRAANEMIHRAETLLKSSLSHLWSGTFHHIGNIILRKEAQVLGYSANFTIIDKEDAKDLLEDCFEDLNLYKREKMFPKKGLIYNIYSLAESSCKKIPETIQSFYPHIEEYIPVIEKITRLYNKKKLHSNVMDFSDLLSNWLKVMNIDEISRKYSQILNYILVDEYQDTNKLQFEILKKLSSCHNNILVVGDDAQSIYSFRAADINNILDFPKTFPGTRIFKLQTNYRSQKPILDMANEIIQHNLNQFPKQLQPMKTGGNTPCIAETRDVYQQAQFIGQRIMELSQEGIPLNEIAVLFRSRFQALELEMELIKRNIPYLIRGGLRFFEQAHIKDVFSYLKILINPKDELSFKRAVCLHKGIGRSYSYKIWEKFDAGKNTFTEIEKTLPQRQREGFRNFSNLFLALKKIASPENALKEILKNYTDYCHLSFDNADERILDLEELTKMSSQYSSIRSFLLDLGSFEDFKGETRLKSDTNEDILVLSTIHQAKGLEWEAVFLIGLSEYDFPHPKSLGSQAALEEERRLFYVAVTRTKSILYIIYPQIKYTFKNGAILSQPSMFLHELSQDSYEELKVEQNFNL